MVIGICLLGLISNIAHFGSASAARKMPKSLQPAKPAVTSLDALASFQQQQAEDALKLQKEREAAERLLGNAGESLQRYKDAALLPCDASLAGTQGTAPDGTLIICTADGSWRPIRDGTVNTRGAPGAGTDQDEAQRRRAEREHRLQEALASPTLAVDFTDANGHDQPHAPASTLAKDSAEDGNTRRALLIVSDGMDNHSRHSERSTKRLVSEIDFPIYAINVWQPQYGNRYAIQRRDPETLESISAPTGGRAFAVRDLKKLPAVTELISLEIRHEYVLGYVPSNHASDGMFHKIRINVDTDDRLRISNRAGYYSPVH
jgi:VWFA-related protein